VTITIRLLEEKDVQTIPSAFTAAGWGGGHGSPSLYERYLAEQEKGERLVLVAHFDGEFAGYGTIRWQSDYPPFAEKGIPEINDLDVLPRFRRRGIATRIMDEAEKRVFKRSPVVGIGFGMYAGYGPAQRMYILRGYVPDGLGLFYKDKPVIPGKEVLVDDDLALYLTKEKGKGQA